MYVRDVDMTRVLLVPPQIRHLRCFNSLLTIRPLSSCCGKEGEVILFKLSKQIETET